MLAATQQGTPDGNGQKLDPAVPALIGPDARTGQPVLQLPLPTPDVLRRGVAALQTILQGLPTGGPR